MPRTISKPTVIVTPDEAAVLAKARDILRDLEDRLLHLAISEKADSMQRYSLGQCASRCSAAEDDLFQAFNYLANHAGDIVADEFTMTRGDVSVKRALGNAREAVSVIGDSPLDLTTDQAGYVDEQEECHGLN